MGGICLSTDPTFTRDYEPPLLQISGYATAAVLGLLIIVAL